MYRKSDVARRNLKNEYSAKNALEMKARSKKVRQKIPPPPSRNSWESRLQNSATSTPSLITLSGSGMTLTQRPHTHTTHSHHTTTTLAPEIRETGGNISVFCRFFNSHEIMFLSIG
jgi:hypothetical protein